MAKRTRILSAACEWSPSCYNELCAVQRANVFRSVRNVVYAVQDLNGHLLDAVLYSSVPFILACSCLM